MSNNNEFNWNGPGAEELYDEAKGAKNRINIEYVRKNNIINKINNENIIVNGKASQLYVCNICGKIDVKISSQRFCQECAINRLEVSQGYVYIPWAKAVKARDGVCQVCGNKHELEAHHIVPKLQEPSLARNVDNGITLCAKCHRIGEGALHRILGNVYSKEAFAVWFSTRKNSLVSLDKWI